MISVTHHDKGTLIVMNNCRIHRFVFVVDAINERSYKPLFMPLNLPSLNSIAECWSKIRKLTSRNPLDSAHIPPPASMKLLVKLLSKDCKGWIRRTETFRDRCVAEEIVLK